jgi:phosphonate transport system substrate-binding protein
MATATLTGAGPRDDGSSVEEPTRLRMGIAEASAMTSFGTPKTPASEMQGRLDAMCAALARVLGLEVEPLVARSYPELLEALQRGEVDFAWLPPVVALRAASAGRALPIVLPIRRGVSTFYTTLFARQGSRIVRPPDLVGTRAAWVDSNSASGYLVIRAALRAQGIALEEAFWEERFYGSHAAVVRAVLDRKADVGATYLHHMPGGPGIWRAGFGDEPVQIVTRVGPIPADVIAAGVHVPVPLIRRVQAELVAGADPGLRHAAAQLLEAEGFTAAESTHLEPLERLLGFLEDTATRWTSVMPPPGSPSAG